MSSRTWWAPATIGLAVVALVAVGGAIATVALPGPTPASLTVPAGERYVAVTTESYDGAVPAQATPVMTEPERLTLGDAGRITATQCRAGATVASGSSPLTVDDRPALALATSVPLWRDLAVGATGADVAALQTELARLGYAVTVDGVYGASTRGAVRDLQRALGVPRATGAIAAASVVWLPTPEVVVSTCAGRVGDQAAGEVATVAGGLSALRVAPPSGGSWVARYADSAAPVGLDGTIDDPAFLAAVAAGPDLAVALSDRGAGTVKVSLAWATARDVAILPPSAVVVGPDSGTCVIAEDGPRAVTVVASALGESVLTFDGPIPTRVEADPASGSTCR
jgi:peptidoglycan hydrolase-like protein with peptidoglycan-binding domain